MEMPWYQRTLRVLTFAAAGALAAGQLLDSLTNTIELMTPTRAVIATVIVVAAAVAVEIHLRRKPLPWRTRGGGEVRLRGLGPQHKGAVVGIVLLLWIGPLFRGPASAPGQSESLPGPMIRPLFTEAGRTPIPADTARSPAPAKPELVSFALNSEESFYTTDDEPFDPHDERTEEELHASDAIWRETDFAGFEGPIASRTAEGGAVDYALARAIGVEVGDEHENYFGTGDSATTAMVLTADSAARENLRSRLSPVYDLTIINRGETTTVLFAMVLHVIHYKDDFGADWPLGEVEPSVLNALHRYPVRLSEIVERELDVDRPDTLQALPPIELPPNRAARIQIQLLPSQIFQHAAFVGRLCLLFHGAPPVCTSEFAALL